MPRRQLAILALGVGAHLAWLLGPVAVLGRAGEACTDPAVLAFLAGAIVLSLGDLARSLGGTEEDTALDLGLERAVSRLAAAEGAALLVVFWAALVEHALVVGRGPHAPSVVAGLLLMGGGAALRLASIRSLGRFFGTQIRVYPSQPLVRSGVYRVVRHPSETGLLAAATGASLLLTSPLALALCVGLLLPLSALRVREEDRALAASFGEAHRRYVREVGSLVPRLRPRRSS